MHELQGSAPSDPETTLAAAFERQAESCAALGSPLYARLLSLAKRELARAGPLAAMMAPFSAHRVGDAVPLRLLAALHRFALAGEAPELAAHLPSCGGDADAERAWHAATGLIERSGCRLSGVIAEPLQTNEVSRSAALLLGFLFLARETRRPLRIFEIGASAGLNLRWDRYRYVLRSGFYGPHSASVVIRDAFEDASLPFHHGIEVVDRRGCDSAPIDPTSRDGRLKLLSYIWADQPDRVALVAAACDVAADVPVSLERDDAVSWLRNVLSVPVAGTTTVVVHTVVLQYLSDSARAGLETVLADAGARASADAPLARLSLEPRPSPTLRAQIWPGGTEHGLAHATMHGRNIRWCR